MPVIHSQPKCKQFVQVNNDPTKIVRLKGLKPEHQQQIWRGIKKTEPELAQMLQFDEGMQQLKTTFDASVVLDRNEAERFYHAGKSDGGSIPK